MKPKSGICASFLEDSGASGWLILCLCPSACGYSTIPSSSGALGGWGIAPFSVLSPYPVLPGSPLRLCCLSQHSGGMAWASLFLRLSWPLPRGAALLGQCVMSRCLNESRCGDTIRQGSSSLDPKSPHPSAALFPTLPMTTSRARQAPAPAPLCPRPRTWLHRAHRALLVPGSLLVSALCTHTGTQTQTPTPTPPLTHDHTHPHPHTTQHAGPDHAARQSRASPGVCSPEARMCSPCCTPCGLACHPRASTGSSQSPYGCHPAGLVRSQGGSCGCKGSFLRISQLERPGSWRGQHRRERGGHSPRAGWGWSLNSSDGLRCRLCHLGNQPAEMFAEGPGGAPL